MKTLLYPIILMAFIFSGDILRSKEIWKLDPNYSSSIVVPTAHTMSAGSKIIRNHELLGFSYSNSISNKLQIGFGTILPIDGLIISGGLKYNFLNIKNKLYLSGALNTTFFVTSGNDISIVGYFLGLASYHPIKIIYINLGIGSIVSNEFNFSTKIIAIPSVHLIVTKNIKIIIENIMNISEDNNGNNGLLSYLTRFHGIKFGIDLGAITSSLGPKQSIPYLGLFYRLN